MENEDKKELNTIENKSKHVSVVIDDVLLDRMGIQFDSSKKESSYNQELIAQCTDIFLQRIEDIKFSARRFVPSALEYRTELIQELITELENGSEELKSKDPLIQMQGVHSVFSTIRRLEASKRSEFVGILIRGLFLSLFSEYDTYISGLLKGLYTKKPALFNNLSGSMTISEMLEYQSLDDIKAIILNNDIEKFRRESLVKQFCILENRFGLKLTRFERWPDFVECAQRRNLIAHCDGIISEQYLNVCKEQGYELNDKMQIGERLILNASYFFDICNLLGEVGIKLCQTLWRKIIPEDIPLADDHLISISYDYLTKENWKMVEVCGEFAQSLPNISSDANHMILLVNHAISLKFGGNAEKAQEMLNNLDWSATHDDFKLASFVLNEKYDDAAKIMRKIGKKSNYVNEYAYHSWPLFIEFRETQQFLDSYEEIYGYSFISKLQDVAESVDTEIEDSQTFTP